MARATLRALEIHGGQIQGRRKRQEDSLAIERYAPREALLVVADGLGGHPAGDIASSEGVAEFLRSFGRLREAGSATPKDWMEDSIHCAQRHLLKQQRTNAEQFGMATTLVALYVKARTLWAASVGDSYLLRLRDGSLARLNELHGENGGVTSAIGFNLTEIDLGGPLKGEPGDRYLLATDGIITLDDTDLTDLLGSARSTEAAVSALLEAVEQRAHAYQDNVTLIAAFL